MECFHSSEFRSAFKQAFPVKTTFGLMGLPRMRVARKVFGDDGGVVSDGGVLNVRDYVDNGALHS